MVKVISFSLWGSSQVYLVGAIKNVESAALVYPDFECWIYLHEPSVPKETIEALKAYGNVRLILKEGDLLTEKPMMWRFEAIDDPTVTIMMSRDLDSRFWRREQMAVREWLDSDKVFHIMRDHPWHKSKIQGGMFGVKKTSVVWKPLMDLFAQNQQARVYDQTFLADVIYPLYRDSLMIHASFHKYEGKECYNFPLTHAEDDYKFVGEYVYSDESRNQVNRNELIRGYI
jgi:protein O-GlcNAc transferase